MDARATAPASASAFAQRAPEIEAQQLDADLLAVMRALNRMRPELLRQHAWVDVEAACLDLHNARTRLKRGRGGEGSTEEV